MLNGVLADYDVLDARMPAGHTAGLLAGGRNDNYDTLGGIYLGLFGQLEGWYPESWHWAAFGVPLSDTTSPYATDLLNSNYNLDTDELYCGCYTQGQYSELNYMRMMNTSLASVTAITLFGTILRSPKSDE